jgi:DNA primase
MRITTIAELAAARGLNPDLLRNLGMIDVEDGVEIPWYDRHGVLRGIHVRHSLDDRPKYTWRTDPRREPSLWGEAHLDDLLVAPERVVITESEIDAVALRMAGISALATGGSTSWREEYWQLLSGFGRVVGWREDEAGAALLDKLVRTRPAQAPPVYVCDSLGYGEKDAGRLLARHGRSAGCGILRAVVEAARPCRLEAPPPSPPRPRPARHADEGGDRVRTIKERVGILDLAGDPPPWAGSRTTWNIRCPFHEDREPSLSVDIDKNLFRCFGCDAAGDVIRWVELAEGLDFLGALDWLEDRFDIPRPVTSFSGAPTFRLAIEDAHA